MNHLPTESGKILCADQCDQFEGFRIVLGIKYLISSPNIL